MKTSIGSGLTTPAPWDYGRAVMRMRWASRGASRWRLFAIAGGCGDKKAEVSELRQRQGLRRASTASTSSARSAPIDCALREGRELREGRLRAAARAAAAATATARPGMVVPGQPLQRVQGGRRVRAGPPLRRTAAAWRAAPARRTRTAPTTRTASTGTCSRGGRGKPPTSAASSSRLLRLRPGRASTTKATPHPQRGGRVRAAGARPGRVPDRTHRSARHRGVQHRAFRAACQSWSPTTWPGSALTRPVSVSSRKARPRRPGPTRPAGRRTGAWRSNGSELEEPCTARRLAATQPPSSPPGARARRLLLGHHQAEGKSLRRKVDTLEEQVTKQEQALPKLQEVLDQATKLLARNSADIGNRGQRPAGGACRR